MQTIQKMTNVFCGMCLAGTAVVAACAAAFAADLAIPTLDEPAGNNQAAPDARHNTTHESPAALNTEAHADSAPPSSPLPDTQRKMPCWAANLMCLLVVYV